MNPAVDHVILVVDDLEAAADLLLDQHGLASVTGGRHTGHGTGNRVVPLGDCYLELMAVLDPEEAEDSTLGRWAAETARPGLVPAALCLRTEDIDREADRLGLEAVAMSRERPDRVMLSWRLVGLDETFGPDRLPFFIQWDGSPDHHPGRSHAHHRVAPLGITAIELSGDPDLIRRRLGPHELPTTVRAGSPGVAKVVIATEGGEVVL